MANLIEYDIIINDANSVKTLDSLNTELANLNNEIKDVDTNSDAFKTLSSKIQKINKDLGEANETMEGFTAGQKIEAFKGSIDLLGGSVATTMGSLALFGVESDKVGEIQTKVQGAIAVAMGLREAAEGAVALAVNRRKIAELASNAVTKIGVGVQTAFNAVLNANPIGLIIITVTAFIGIITALYDKVEVVTKAIDFLWSGVMKLGQALGLTASESEKAEQAIRDLANASAQAGAEALEMAKAQGKAQNELNAIERQRLVDIKAGAKDQKDIAEAQRQIDLFDAKLATSIRNEQKKQKDADDASDAARLKAAQDRAKADRDAKDRAAQADKEKEEAIKQAKAAKIKEITKQLADDVELIGLNEYDKERELAQRKFDDLTKDLEKNGEAYKNAKLLLNEELDKIDDDEGKAQLKKRLDKIQTDNDLRLEQQELEIQSQADYFQLQRDMIDAKEAEDIASGQYTEDQLVSIHKIASDKKKKIDEDEAKAKKALVIAAAQGTLQTAMSVNDALASFAKEGSKDAKNLAISGAIIQTLMGALAAYSSASAIPVVGWVLGPIAAAAALVAGYANVKKIKDTKIDPKSSPSTPGVSTPASVSIPQSSRTVETPSFDNIQSQAPTTSSNTAVRAYVVQGDVADANEADAKLKARRSL